MMRGLGAGSLVLALVLGGCASFESAGLPATGFLTPEIHRAYIPLDGSAYVVLEGHGAAMRIAPGVAVTNAHNENLIDSASVIGTAHDYDLMYFHAAGTPVTNDAAPEVGEAVIAYGQGVNGELRMARGIVLSLEAKVLPICETCPIQTTFTYRADAGRGFSGGPVVDAETGKLVGITFGYRDSENGKGPRVMYAYDMNRVRAELKRAESRAVSAAKPTD